MAVVIQRVVSDPAEVARVTQALLGIVNSFREKRVDVSDAVFCKVNQYYSGNRVRTICAQKEDLANLKKQMRHALAVLQANGALDLGTKEDILDLFA